MGQQLFKSHLEINDNNVINLSTILSNDAKEDVSYFCPLNISSDPTINPQVLNNDEQISSFQTKYIKQIRNYLFQSTKSVQWEEMNTEINEKFIKNILTFISEKNMKILEEQNNQFAYQEQLQTSLTTKLKTDDNMNLSNFSESFIDSTSESDEQLSYFAIESLTSILLILIKSAEKNDPTIVHQILTLTGRLCEKLPMEYLLSTNSSLLKSLEPLTNYINELFLSTDSILSKQTIKIQLSFFIAKRSFKDLLPLLNQLIFNTTEVYNVKRLIIQMNNFITKTINEYQKKKNNGEETTVAEFISLNYLKSINSYPNTELIKLNDELFTGQFISSIILSYLDILNEINSSSKQSKLSSISCEFHPITFKNLFNIIEQLILLLPSNNIINHILTICLRLLTTHLQLLSDIKSNIPDLKSYGNDDELKNWFELLFKLSCNESSEEIAKEASKSLIYIIDIQLSVSEKFSLIHQYIIDNKHSILIEQLLIELNKNKILSNWIEILCNENEKMKNLDILYSFIDIYFNSNEKQKSEIQEILFSFQYLLLSQLFIPCQTKKFINNEFQLSSLIIQYLTYIFKNCIKDKIIMNDLLNSIIMGLCLMTETTNKNFLYENIQPIFISILPLLTEYYLQNLNNEYSEFLICLIGKISYVLIIGLPEDLLEIKHINTLKLPIFSGGCQIDNYNDLLNSNLAVYSQFQLIYEKENDLDFLMSIYNKTNEGAQLISKLKLFIKDKRVLQKSIEEQVNDACAAIFAVYIKHYRRINLAKSELFRTDQDKPYSQLLSIYEYANRIQNLFATVKGQGGDCNELYKQIKIRSLFLLLTVKESEFIPIVKENLTSIKSKTESNFERQCSRWTKAKSILKLLQNLFQACIRFKKLMLEKNAKYDYENLLNRSIENFIYGDFYKSLTLIINDEKQSEIDELEKCFHRQHQRAIIRLITYRFIKIFIQNILNLNNNDQSIKILSIYLPYLRKTDLDWSYFNNIQVSNNQLKNEISNTYYSIIKLILSHTNLTQNIFSLLNLSYESIDIYYLYKHEIIEILLNTSELIYLKLMTFNWFQLFVFKLCENIEIEILRNTSNQILQQQQIFIFNNFISNQLKSLKDNSEEQNISINWFLQQNQPSINQYLVVLLRSIHFYKHLLFNCATIDYLEQFIYIYHHNQSNITRLFIIKLLRYLIPYIPDNDDGIAKNLIEKFLSDILNSIGDKSTSKEIQTELIYMYRTIISINSSWQIIATEFVFNAIKFYLNIKSIEINNINEMNQLLASLFILGGYIESYRIGSIVKTEIDDEDLVGLIINIDGTDKPYQIQYFETNQIESVTIDKLQLEIDVPPPNLLNPNDSILDTLGYFIEIDTSINQSLLLLQLKRCSISVLYNILNNKNIIEIFMNKPYVLILGKLCLSNPLEKIPEQLTDLRVFNKQHLEKYCLSLDRCQIIEDEQDNSNGNKIIYNQLVIDALSPSINGWKPYVSEDEMKLFKKGRIGNEEISIVSMPQNMADAEAIQECGIKHRFRGRIAPNEANTRTTFPTFIINNLRLSEGNWYYCVRLPVGGLVQVGWATNGFSPSNDRGVGDDLYSWSYDGSRAAFFYKDGFYGQFWNTNWKPGDILGCGIEIDGERTRIKYWLNERLLGTAFAHNVNIRSSKTPCNLLPNGPTTTYYPAVSINADPNRMLTCEFILSPEDMGICPLPNGYKPLLLPNIVQTENSIVEYPFNAYLIGNKPEEFFLYSRTKSSKNFLRDFVNEHHLETTFNLDEQYLILPDNSDGLLLSLDNDETSSHTISFDFQILSTDDKLEFSLIKLKSIEIPSKKTDKRQQCVIIFLLKEQQIKVYINNNCQIFDHVFHDETINKLNIHILPEISAKIQNLAIWKYALSEEQINRLCTYGLFYIANDYQQLKEYRKQVNTISFSKNQQEFSNELLLPFNKRFTKEIWEQKKKEADDDESKYFKSHNNTDYSTIDLFGNKTYLVLNKSNEQWCKFTLVLDISIPQFPTNKEKLTLIALNIQTELYITDNEELCLETDDTKDMSKLKILLNEYFRLFISVDEQSIKIYVNDNLEIERQVCDDRFQIQENRIDLFKELNHKKNTTDENTLRVSLKSITYLNHLITIDQLQSPTLISPTIEIIGSSLIAMGYKIKWIQSVIDQNKDIPKVLRERKQEFVKIDFENEQNRVMKIFSKLNLSINPEVLKDLINSSKFDTDEQIIDVAQRLSAQLISSQSSNPSLDKTEFGENWFSQFVEGLDIPLNISEWLRDGISTNDEEDNIYQLLDLTQLTTKKSPDSLQYSHKNLSFKQYSESRIACEYGLMTSYARSTASNMLKIWSDDGATLFPLEKFGDYKLLKLINYRKIDKQEQINRIYLLIKSILKNEIKQILENLNKNDLKSKAPLLYYLQKDIIIQSIQFSFKPSLLTQHSEINEYQPNFNFVQKILNLFAELLSDKSFLKQHQIDLISPILFPTSLINLIFNLFLLIPSNQSKISIIHLFTTLVRISDCFILNNQFFFQLLIDLSSDKITIDNKKLQISLIDLIYILLIKQKEYQSKLPENIQDLFILIDVIKTWTNPTKQIILPEKFLQQSNDILGEIFKLNQNDFEKSNQYFNIATDQELISLMNNSLSNNDSFVEFILTLPTESEPNSIFYKKYILLSNIQADCIQIRARFIYLLNKFIEPNLSTIDLTLPSEQSFLVDQIRTIKIYLLSSTKFRLFNESLRKTESDYSTNYLNVEFDTVKASTDTDKSENTMFYQAYQQLHKNAHVTFRRSNEQIWYAQYVGMHSSDAGGPYRDSITRICWDICSTRLPLFILCPNRRTNSGLNRDCWIPNVFPPTKSISNKIRKQYQFIGQLMGMAIRKKHYLDIKFPTLLWKKLLKEQITFEDIEAIDIRSFAIINEMKKNIEQIKSIDTDHNIDSVFSSVMSELRFDVVSSSGQTYELIPGGKDIPITSENFKQYCTYYQQYRLNEFNRQIDFIRQGLYSVIPCYYLSLLTDNELEEAVCGKGRIDVEILKRNTIYGGDYNQDSPVIERFWIVMNQMFTDEQKKLFLIFVWGRSTLPTRDEDMKGKFIITSFPVYRDEVDKTLPRSHTCFFTLDLPAYSTAEIMYDRLNYAISSCSSIDGDGAMDDGFNAE